jgi:hypothetical protein
MIVYLVLVSCVAALLAFVALSQCAKTEGNVVSSHTLPPERRMHETTHLKANPLPPSSKAHLRRQRSKPLNALEMAPASTKDDTTPKLSRHRRRSEPIAQQRSIIQRADTKRRSCYDAGFEQAPQAFAKNLLQDAVHMKRLSTHSHGHQFQDMANLKSVEMVADLVAFQDPDYKEYSSLAENMSASFASLEASKSFAEVVDTTCFHLGISRFELWLNKRMWDLLKTLWSEIKYEKEIRITDNACTQQRHNLEKLEVTEKHSLGGEGGRPRPPGMSVDAKRKMMEELKSTRKGEDKEKEAFQGELKAMQEKMQQQMEKEEIERKRWENLSEVDSQHRSFKAQVTQHLVARVSGAASGAIVTRGKIAVVP